MSDRDLPLFQRHSATSKSASERIEPHAGTLRAIVLALLRTRGPMTDEAMQIELQLNPSTQRPRRIELVRAGLVRDSGRQGLTSSGRAAVIWEAA